MKIGDIVIYIGKDNKLIYLKEYTIYYITTTGFNYIFFMIDGINAMSMFPIEDFCTLKEYRKLKLNKLCSTK